MYIHICIYIYIYVCACVYIYTYMYSYMCVYVCKCERHAPLRRNGLAIHPPLTRTNVCWIRHTPPPYRNGLDFDRLRPQGGGFICM